MAAHDLDPVTAVTAENPYPYYASLVAERPFYRDERIGAWVASSAHAVDAVLTCPAMRVRPPSEPVPNAIVGTILGDTFGRLVRMTDGPSQLLLKSAMSSALAQTDLRELATTSARCAEELVHAVRLDDAATLGPYMIGLSPLVIATLLGFPLEDRRAAIDWARVFVGSLAANAGAGERESGASATEALRSRIQQLLDASAQPGSLLAALAGEAQRHDVARDAVVSNAIGLFLQGYEGTAGLIGNVIVELGNRSTDFRRSLLEDRALLEAFVIEVARHDSPVQNTRRYAAEPVTLFDCDIAAGDCVLVVLAAANRDPKGEMLYTFGSGAHACNGMRIAVTIAAAGIASLLGHRPGVAALRLSGYLPRANVRIPVFASA